MSTLINSLRSNGKTLKYPWKKAYPNKRMALIAEYLSVNMQKI